MSDDFQADSPLSQTKEQPVRAAEDLRSAAALRARQLREAAGHGANLFRDHAGREADQLRQNAEEQWEVAKQKAKDLQVELEHYVRENPTKSVLIVFGAGLFLGMLLRR